MRSSMMRFSLILVALTIAYIAYNKWQESNKIKTDASEIALREDKTIEEMKILVKKHTDSENEHDLQGVLTTLVESPVYEIHPARLKLEGKENVRAFYREHFDSFFPLIASFQLINECWTPQTACMEYDLFLKAPYDQKPYRILVVLTAKNNLLLGERFYVSDELAKLMSGAAFSLWKKF